MYQPKNKNEKMESYRAIFIDRETMQEIGVSDYDVHLYPNEVISRQVEQSTAKTIVMYQLKKEG